MIEREKESLVEIHDLHVSLDKVFNALQVRCCKSTIQKVGDDIMCLKYSHRRCHDVTLLGACQEDHFCGCVANYFTNAEISF